ncbi:hypothetical protein [Compostimonas suwonensis]|uniref:Uncharacterized protein n=1 Tax=Compostimonas suwonensis TaxID=1048394 RepID=A0A2M9BUB8_9MICO|nr:hypothetical protein [Compostimonas suwonensis]PJJ61545.1 hypothetical protein CLV54_2490 [Compostimonas suwonensis]
MRDGEVVRATKMLMAAVIAAAVAVAVSGCVDGAPVQPTPSPSADAATSTPSADPATSSTPSADPAVSRAAGIVIGATSFSIVDEEGAALASFGYFDPAASAIDAVTAQLGIEPTVEEIPAGMETPPITRYIWGGFRLFDAEVPTEKPWQYDFSVSATEPEAVPGVGVSTTDGFAVGDLGADVESFPSASAQRYDADGREVLFIGLEETVIGSENGMDLSYSIGLTSDPSSEPIEQIFAPYPNFGV